MEIIGDVTEMQDKDRANQLAMCETLSLANTLCLIQNVTYPSRLIFEKKNKKGRLANATAPIHCWQEVVASVSVYHPYRGYLSSRLANIASWARKSNSQMPWLPLLLLLAENPIHCWQEVVASVSTVSSI